MAVNEFDDKMIKSSNKRQLPSYHVFCDIPFNIINVISLADIYLCKISSRKKHLLTYSYTLHKLPYPTHCMIAWSTNNASMEQIQRAMTMLQKISTLPEIENWVFSLSESEVEHKLTLHWISAQFFALDSVLFSPLHMARYIFSFSTSPNRVHKTTVKQIVTSPRGSLTFEKWTSDWKDYGLNSEAESE